MSRRSPLWQLAWPLCVVVACGGVSSAHHDGSSTADAGRGTLGPGAASAGGSAGNGGADVASGAAGADAGAAARTSSGGAEVGPGGASGGGGGVSAGGASGARDAGSRGGTSSSGGTGGVDSGANPDAAIACVEDRDCPRPPTACGVRRCATEVCIVVDAALGTVISDVPGDCHDTVCDGVGGVSERPLDENDVPASANPCLAGTCDKAGVPGITPLPSGTACAGDGNGGILCDGSGRCVECLAQSDCAPGLHCQRDNSCATTPCTDTDCGGGCPLCDPGKKCLTNFDCLSYACDYSLHVCVAQSCTDHHQDGNETDVDCGGGGQCKPCPTGGSCDISYDCQTGFCDSILRTCVVDGCTDHAQDGNETDIDCGGPDCQPCAADQWCNVTADCQPKLTCSQGFPHLCE